MPKTEIRSGPGLRMSKTFARHLCATGANGSLKQRISLSRTAQELAVFMLSDPYLALRRTIGT